MTTRLSDQAPGDGGGVSGGDDDGVETPEKIKVGQTAQGFIGPKGDDDWFRIKLQPGTYTAAARNFNTDLPFRVHGYIFDFARRAFLWSGQPLRCQRRG